MVAYLQSIDVDDFDAERRERIERLLESLSTTADDVPQRIAMWLVDDPTIWLAILGERQDRTPPRRPCAARKTAGDEHRLRSPRPMSSCASRKSRRYAAAFRRKINGERRPAGVPVLTATVARGRR